MKRLSFGILLCSSLYADWASDVLAKSAQLYDKTREKTIQIYHDTLTNDTLTQESNATHLQAAIWERVSDDLREGSTYIQKLQEVPDSTWVGEDKEDVRQELNGLIENIIEGLVGDDISRLKSDMDSLQKKIAQNKEQILTYREKRIGAPEHSLIYTTKSGYDEKIKNLQDENRILQNEIRMIKERLQKRFAQIGVKLSLDQIDVLLSRVDGDDIIEISLVMDTLKYITAQIRQLMQQSQEELTQAKRYYGMHQVLLELVVYMQQRYIEKCDKIYLPKIDKIIADAKAMMEQTEALKAKEESGKRARVYAKNLEAQEWTLKVAQAYRQDLLLSKAKMVEAQRVAMANLQLSRNTYNTVLLSADLYSVMSESQKMFTQIEKMQVPTIVPFENLQIKQKYQELTKKLQ